MDQIGAFIANLHGLLGHDKAAAYLGEPPGDRDRCVLCAYERQSDDEHRAAVIDAIGSRAPEKNVSVVDLPSEPDSSEPNTTSE